MKEMTIKMQEALADAHQQANRDGHAQIQAIHVLFALAKQPEGILRHVIEKAGLGVESLLEECEKNLELLPRQQGVTCSVGAGDELSDLMNKAESERVGLGDQYTSVEHMLLALIEVNSVAKQILIAAGLDRDKMLNALAVVRGNCKVTDLSLIHI